MKKLISSELCGQVIHHRTLNPLGLISLYEVEFTADKYAVIRFDKENAFQEGDIFRRINDVWYCGDKLIHPYSFQFVDKAEAQRAFIEYEQ